MLLGSEFQNLGAVRLEVQIRGAVKRLVWAKMALPLPQRNQPVRFWHNMQRHKGAVTKQKWTVTSVTYFPSSAW